MEKSQTTNQETIKTRIRTCRGGGQNTTTITTTTMTTPTMRCTTAATPTANATAAAAATTTTITTTTITTKTAVITARDAATIEEVIPTPSYARGAYHGGGMQHHHPDLVSTVTRSHHAAAMDHLTTAAAPPKEMGEAKEVEEDQPTEAEEEVEEAIKNRRQGENQAPSHCPTKNQNLQTTIIKSIWLLSGSYQTAMEESRRVHPTNATLILPFNNEKQNITQLL